MDLFDPVHGKSQPTRLWDVFLLGPFLMWAGTQQRLPQWARTGLVVSGLFTIWYNAENYRRIEQGKPT